MNKMVNKVILQRKRLAAIFVSISILIMGTASLLESMSLDYYSVLGTLEKIIPASVILGGIGWVMGLILDSPPKKAKKGYANFFANEIKKSNDTDLNTLSVEEVE